MSSVEIAGLALAVVPILMAAAGWEVGAPRMMLRQKIKDNKMVELYRQLHDELAMLSATLRGLLESLTTLSDEVRMGLQQLESAAWDAAEVSTALKHRLGSCHAAFSDNLEQILRILDDLVSNTALKLDKQDFLVHSGDRPLYGKLQELRRESGKNNTGFKDRVRFTSKVPKLRKGLKTLNERNLYLERLLSKVWETGLPGITSETTVARPAPSKKICELASALYKSMATHWACACHAQHEARLCLNVPYGPGIEDLPTKLDLFMMSVNKWQESSVHIDVDILPDQAIQESPVKVRFENPDTVKQIPRKPRRSSVTEESSMKRIDAMCNLIEHAHRDGAALEMLLSKRSLWHIKSTRARTKVQEPQPDTSLCDILGRAKRLPQRDRRRLAVILANALLHLNDTKWLDEYWSNKHIHFMYRDNGSMDVSRPYVSVAFHAAGSSDHYDDLLQLHECPPLLSLGILLLELGISERLESRRTDDDLVNGQANVNSNLSTAKRVLEESSGDMIDSYRAVVEACLDCRFFPPESTCDFSDEDFRSLVYNKIVVPLEKELFDGWHEKPEDVWRAMVMAC